MNRHDILQKAVEKAIRNGYFIDDEDKDRTIINIVVGSLKKNFIKIHVDFKRTPSQYWQTQSTESKLQLYSILFDTDFAKAFFGSDMIYNTPIDGTASGGGGNIGKIERWKHCLMTMVLEEDPVLYLGKYV